MKRFCLILSIFFCSNVKSFAADYFWINGSGNWSDLNHWATTSGGSVTQPAVPTALDNVFFDSGSGFSPGNNTVTIDMATTFCHNMDWTGAAASPVLAGNYPNVLKIYGSLTFIPAMTFSFTGDVYFEAINTGNTITLAGKILHSDAYFEGTGGWILQDTFSCTGWFYMVRGSLNTNSQTVNALILYSNNSNARTLTLGASVFNLSWASNFPWIMDHTNLSFDCGTSTINITGTNSSFYVFGAVNEHYYDLNFTNSFSAASTAGIQEHSGQVTFHNVTFSGSGKVAGNNTFNDLTFAAGGTYQLQNGEAQTIQNNLNLQGSCTSSISLQSSSAGNFAAISKTTGTVTGFNIRLKDIHATGGANFTAYNSVDLGGNSGWNFLTLPSLSDPGPITGLAALCPGAAGITYSIAPVPGAISYIWSVPPDATIVSGQGDTLITVNFGASISGNITVNAFNGCAASANSSLAVAVNLGNLAAIAGGMQVCTTGTVLTTGNYYFDPSCNLITKIVPGGSNPVTGSVSNCVIIDNTVQTFNVQPYVQRHFDIEPASDPDNATATVTLYIKDQEFVNFNIARTAFPALPTAAGGGNSDPNIGNVRITQYHGHPVSPHNTGNPAPGFYSGQTILITPSLVNYNATYNYWEVTFPVTGFSGFYIHTGIYFPLPITVNYLRGAKQGAGFLLTWMITPNASSELALSLERSVDAAIFTGLYTIKADALRCLSPFSFTDIQPVPGLNYYRLKITDANGKVSYSNTIALLNADKGFTLGINPNPVTGGTVTLNIASAETTKMNIVISDMQGRLVARQNVQVKAGSNTIELNATYLPSGTYTVLASVADGYTKVTRFVKK